VTGVEHSADDALTFTKIIPCLQQKHQDECHDKLISYVTDNWDQKFKGLDLDLIISAIRFAKECKSGSIATRIINWSKESPTKTQAIMEACGGLPEAGTHHSLGFWPALPNWMPPRSRRSPFLLLKVVSISHPL
jgi:hypothetical protein